MENVNAVGHQLNAHKDILGLLTDQVMASLAGIPATGQAEAIVPARSGQLFFQIQRDRCDCEQCQVLRAIVDNL